jgi:hypothetical protein
MQGDQPVCPPGSQARPSPLKGGLHVLQSPFQGGRQRSAATMQGDQPVWGSC